MKEKGVSPLLEEWIRKNYPYMGSKICADYLKISERTFYRYLKHLGLNRDTIKRVKNEVPEYAINYIKDNYVSGNEEELASKLEIPTFILEKWIDILKNIISLPTPVAKERVRIGAIPVMYEIGTCCMLCSKLYSCGQARDIDLEAKYSTMCSRFKLNPLFKRREDIEEEYFIK